MRILFCNYEYPPLGGGGGISNSLLAAELAKEHEVTVLTSQALGLPRQSEEEGVEVIRVPVFFRRQEAVANCPSMMAYVVQGIRAGKKLLGSRSFDVINTHFVLPTGPVGLALSRFFGIPNVLTLHGGDLYEPSKRLSPHRHLLLRMWIRRLLRTSDIVVGQSANTLANMRRFYASEIEGVRIPLGIKRPRIPSCCRRSYGFAEEEILLVTVGRLVARKAIHHLIEVVDRLGDSRVHLLIVGSGPEEAMLRLQCEERKLQNRVHFTGHVTEAEKFRLLALSDLFVSTSQHEGFGLVFLEAMACGLPVVSYDCGGQNDFLEEGVTGHLVPLNEIEKFTGACRRLAQDRELRQQIALENCRRVEELFVERCAQSYESIFREAVARRRIEDMVDLSFAKKLPLGKLETNLIGEGIAGLGGLASPASSRRLRQRLGRWRDMPDLQWAQALKQAVLALPYTPTGTGRTPASPLHSAAPTGPEGPGPNKEEQ